ncbi:helix-turn-helix transcriptional regulator [Candidatus Halobeggiatoa sp. HSG11]|nr:helix-turn-helix transcriptional regulator [Candidatus Halobeggiatoa sp. HSG11]
MQLHEQIKFMRTLKGWSREEMAGRIGLSANGYAKIERGETNLQVLRLEKIAEAFEIELKDLFNFNESMVFNNHNDNHQNSYVSNQNNYIDSAKDLIKELESSRQLIEQQSKEIEYLKQQISDLREMNEILKQKD